MCKADLCGEVWRVMVCMICVLWGVMCQCGLGLMGALLFESGMIWVFFYVGET